jgi:hypothetical protein
MFSGEAVFAPGIPRNKPEQGSPAGGDVFDGCVECWWYLRQVPFWFHGFFIVSTSFLHRFRSVLKGG